MQSPRRTLALSFLHLFSLRFLAAVPSVCVTAVGCACVPVVAPGAGIDVTLNAELWLLRAPVSIYTPGTRLWAQLVKTMRPIITKVSQQPKTTGSDGAYSGLICSWYYLYLVAPLSFELILISASI